MKQVVRVTMVVLVVAAIVLVAGGCSTANPEDKQTMAIAQQFATVVFSTGDSAAAIALVVPLTGLGYVTKDAVDSTILNDKQKSCITPANSVEAGPPGSDLSTPPVTAADTAKGISARVLWVVSYNYRCGNQGYDSNRTTQVTLEKVNGTWGISKCTF